EDNAKQEYEIIIIKGIVLSSDTSVTNIKLTNLYDVNFLNYVEDQLIYEVTVDYENEQLKLDVTTPGKVTFINHLPTRLPVGTTKVSFFITAENGQQGEEIYEIHITRSEASKDNTLKEILITGNGKTILGLQSDALNIFNPETNIYNITLDESYQSIVITRTKNHQNQTLTGTPNSTPILKHGLNEFTFNVRPEDTEGYERTYRVNITIKNSQIELTSLGVQGLDFNETFSKETYHYTLPNVNSKTPEIEIYGTISDTYGEIDGIGKKILKEGLNTFEIIITSEDLQTKKTYTISINVVYSDDYSINEVLLLDQENRNHITFDSQKETYEVTVPYDTNSLDLRITANDSNATIIGAKTYAITQKETLITFKVIAENKEESLTYTIKVIKQEASNDATLNDLEITTDQGEIILGKNGTQMIFDTTTSTYNLKVSRDIKNIKVTYKTTHDHASLLPTSSHNFEREILLLPNQNQVYLIIQAEDGKTTERYNINILQINSKVEIENIVISDYPFTFDKNIKNYDIGKIPANTTTLNIEVTLSDSFASVTGDGIQGISTGKNTLIIKATSEDKTQSVTYTITYEKEGQNGGGNVPKSSDANLYDLKIKGLKNPINFTFNPDINEYTITLSYDDAQFFLEAETHPSATTRNVGLQAIQEGETREIIILVTAEDGTKGKEYKLTITREKANTENELLEFSYVLGGEEFSLDVTQASHNIETTPDKQTIELKAKLPENATATGLGVTPLTNTKTIVIVTVKAQNGDLKNYVVEILKISNDATLKSLEVLDVKTNEVLPFNIAFDPLKTNYLINLDSNQTTEINIVAEANSSLSTITGDKLHNLKSGEGATTDRFNVIVTAQDKTQKIYTITIERQIAPEHSIIIDDLSLIGNNITYLGNDRHPDALQAFIASQKEYIITVPYQLDNVFLSITNKEGAIITGAGNYALTKQETIIYFSIESKSGVSKSGPYSIKIIKEEPSTNSLLKDLSINGKTIEGFDPNIFFYEFNVDVTKVGNINIGAILDDLKAKITGDLGEVIVLPGSNSYKIYVTAEDLSQQVYEIKINSLSYDNQITSLSVENHDLNPIFNQKTLYYEVKVDYKTTSVKVDAASHLKARLIGVGLVQNLQPGDNIITVYAIAENGIEGTKYQINIIREEPNKDATLKNLIIKDKDGNILAFEGEFDPQKFNYIINIPKDKELMSVFIKAEANNALATVFNTGNQLLEGLIDGGYHTILKVTVIAEDPNIRNVYTISIYRDVNLDNSVEIQEVNLIASDGKNYLSDNEFDQSITNYQVTVPYHVTQMNLNIKTVGQVVGAGIKQFGSNHQIIYTFYTVSQSGSHESMRYTITVIKEEAKTDNILTNLTVDGIQVPNFDPNTNTYRITRPKQSNSQIQIDAVASETSSIQGTGLKTLVLGKNTFAISVIAQNGDINTYTIEIDYVDSNAFLENLIVKGTNKDIYNEEDAIDYTTYTFDPETYEYNVVVDSNTKNVRITGAAMDHQNARVTGFGTYPIGINPEKIRIFVTSADNVLTLTYTLNITRYAIPSNNAQLNSLSIENNTISFDKSRYVYEINVSNKINSLKISAETFNPNGIVVIEGYQEGSGSNELSMSVDNLQAGKNVILIKVTAEDGITQSYYKVIVNKEPKTDMLLTVLLILSIMLWIITVLILLINKNRHKNQSTDELIY
ncbi:MAG: cadherin-like beta sandwich domain-containing protein, partial [Candidatus Phytoplasma sp.]|nr:cadherin-like beta sandwich domain-containing protein [Phytoplasma sp.]